jgi:hypothetical protein
VLRDQHGDAAITELTELEAAIGITDNAITVAREEVARDADPVRFNAAAQPFEKAAGALWLRKTVGADGAEAVKVWKQVSSKEGRWKDARAEEIEAR